MRWIDLVCGLVVGGVVATAAHAQWDGVQMLHSSAVTNDGAGSAVDVDRDTMIVGVTGFDLPSKAGAGAAVIFRWQGTTWVEEARLTASDAGAGDRFGQSVAIQGNTAVVGAYLHDLPGKGDAGAVYVFQRSGTTWTQVAKLTASNSAGGDNLGISVDIDGDSIIAGAWFKNGLNVQQGAAYVFTRNAAGVWTQQAQLTDINGSASDWFGNRVAIEGDTAVIAAPGDDVIFTDRGSVQVYTRSGTTWTRRTALDPGLGGASDFFGSFVSIHNGTVAVGAPGNDVTTNGNEGAVYVFTGSGATWSLQQKLTRAGAVVGDSLGNAVAVRGDTIVCGVANFDGIVGTNQGMGVFFTRSGTTWAASEIFMPNETQAQANFGSAVAMSDEFVAAGATSWSRAGANFSGAAYAFLSFGGQPPRTLTLAAPTPQTDDNFGNRMASDDTRLVVGAYNEDGSAGTNQGAVYVYRFQDESFVLEQKLVPSTPQAGAAFGKAIAIDGTTLIVGAPEESGGVGAAYVFFFNGTSWSQQARIASPEGAANRFGSSVDVSGNRAVIGSPEDNVVTSSTRFGAGSADSFLRTGTTWAFEKEFVEASAQTDEAAGSSVAVSGDFVAVGIPVYGNTSPIWRGAVRFYRWTGSTWTTFSLVTGAVANERYGIALTQDGGLFAVGSAVESVDLFQVSGPTITALGTLSNAAFAGFGEVLSLSPTRLVAGLSSYGGAGAAVVYSRSGASFTSLGIHYPGVVDAGDNVGEAVGSVGTAIFAGGGGITLPGGTNQGAVRRLRASDRLNQFPRNSTLDTRYPSVASMFSSAGKDQSLVAETGPLARSGGFSFGATRATLNVPVTPFMASIHTITLADGGNLSTSSADMTLWNRVLVPSGATATVTAGSLLFDLPATLDLGAGASLTLTPNVSTLSGIGTMLPGSTLGASAIEQNGTFSNFGGVVSAASFNNTKSGRVSGYGDYAVGISNAGFFDVDADTQIVGDFSNLAGGSITVFNGTLTVLGTLTNNGSIIGDVAARSALSSERDPDGLFVPPFADRAAQTIYAKGGINMDEGARFQPGVGSIVRTTGSFNCGITQNLRFEMLSRTLQMNGRGGSNLEAMSTDRGQALSALNPNLAASFPIGTLKIGPGNPSQPTIVTIVDNRDNDTLGQSACEAVYVENLIIESGAVLNAPGCRVYYKTITNRGTIPTLPNVLRLYGPCPADLNSDGLVDDADFSIFIVQYDVLDCADVSMPSGCSADLNSDLLVDDQDFSIFVVAYDAVLCP
jgi:hypothetical protein